REAQVEPHRLLVKLAASCFCLGSLSVIRSAKYPCSGSFERFTKGRTTIDSGGVAAVTHSLSSLYIYHTRKFREHAVASVLHDQPSMLLDLWIKELMEMCL